MNPDKKKSSSGESTPKSSHSKSMKSSKSSSKSRTKSSKSESSSSKSNTNGQTPTSSTSHTPDPPSTPTSTIDSSKDKSHHKGYAAFGSRTIKIIWEQHNTSDTDMNVDLLPNVAEHETLNPDLLPILAEDVSYKMWELIKNIRTYSMHSGGTVTSDLVNEVLKDSDCPPVLGPMDTEWDRIDYDGSFFFNSDKVIELRNEYQKDVQITMPMGPPFMSTWPIQGGHRELMHSFMQSIFLITLGGSEQDFDSVRQYIYAAPFIGGCYRVLLVKMIQTLAFKQTNHVKLRCWRLMQTLAQHPTCRDVYCREDFFHLAEIFICQLLDTYDVSKSIMKTEMKYSPMETDEPTSQLIKIEDIKEEELVDLDEERPNITPPSDVKEEFVPVEEELPQSDRIYRLEKDDDNESTADQMEGIEFSPYIADKVDLELVDDLCETIGLIGAINEFFNTECMHLILRRLESFFDKKKIFSSSDYEFISRAIRGLFALGEYAFREFIPYMKMMNILKNDDIPHSLRCEFARCAIFLRGHDDIFLYEWLNELCSYRLLPFMTHYAQYHQKLIRYRHLKRRAATFKIIPKVSAKRIIIASSCSPAPNKINSLEKFFPNLEIPAKSNSPIRFKFSSGGRQIPLKVKPATNGTETNGIKSFDLTRDIIIAKRKLFKPLTDEKKFVHLSNYHLLRI
ncbi:uncharacterized protein LOC129907593 [Episyrphus balteatus]|uniref:uncharacterized protein LOC129907593 n=1 Tax=Episyrphus balteatus TaxID=286459 RepID=UPI002485E0AE|nr:uncharacterized protein LOC129907593 [Episyrphus balteatus]